MECARFPSAFFIFHKHYFAKTQKGEMTVKKKRTYQPAIIQLVELPEKDIITTSSDNDIEEDPGENDGEWAKGAWS